MQPTKRSPQHHQEVHALPAEQGFCINKINGRRAVSAEKLAV
jgi:hypothetical protein